MHLQTSETDGSTRTNRNSMGRGQTRQIVFAVYEQDHVISLPKTGWVWTLWSQNNFPSFVARTSSWFIFMLILSGLGLMEASRLSFQNIFYSMQVSMDDTYIWSTEYLFWLHWLCWCIDSNGSLGCHTDTHLWTPRHQWFKM